MSMLSFEFYIAVLKYAFCAFSVACLVGLLWAGVEQLFPNILLSRHTVTYGPSRTRAIPIIGIGALGLIAALVIWATGSALTGTLVHYAIAAGSAVVFDIGAM